LLSVGYLNSEIRRADQLGWRLDDLRRREPLSVLG
jgi:hypothetical protein